jgi:hypothetical protein
MLRYALAEGNAMFDAINYQMVCQSFGEFIITSGFNFFPN